MVKSRQSSSDGFTLIEVLITVIVLVILMKVVLVGIAAATKFSQRRACETDMRSITGAIAAYSNDWQSSPVAPFEDFDMNLYSKVAATGIPPTNLVPDYQAPLSTNSVYSVKLRVYADQAKGWKFTGSLINPKTNSVYQSVIGGVTTNAEVTELKQSKEDIATACKIALP